MDAGRPCWYARRLDNDGVHAQPDGYEAMVDVARGEEAMVRERVGRPGVLSRSCPCIVIVCRAHRSAGGREWKVGREQATPTTSGGR
jgi:hypothetical protein